MVVGGSFWTAGPMDSTRSFYSWIFQLRPKCSFPTTELSQYLYYWARLTSVSLSSSSTIAASESSKTSFSGSSISSPPVFWGSMTLSVISDSTTNNSVGSYHKIELFDIAFTQGESWEATFTPCWDENLWRICVWTTWRRGVSQRTTKGD